MSIADILPFQGFRNDSEREHRTMSSSFERFITDPFDPAHDLLKWLDSLAVGGQGRRLMCVCCKWPSTRQESAQDIARIIRLPCGCDYRPGWITSCLKASLLKSEDATCPSCQTLLLRPWVASHIRQNRESVKVEDLDKGT